MKKLGKSGTWRMKALHLIFATMWAGGVMALVCLQLAGNPQTPEAINQAAQDQLLIDRLFLIPGGLGIVGTALLYPRLTRLGKLSQLWIRWKWILTVVLIALGAGLMGTLVKANAAYTAQALAAGALDPAVYWSNAHIVAIAGIVQLALMLVVLHLSITKPQKGKQAATRADGEAQ